MSDDFDLVDNPQTGNTEQHVQDHYRQMVEDATLRREAAAPLQGKAWFEATFGENGNKIDLLEPIDDTVNYAVTSQPADPWTHELAVEKYWKEENGFIGIDSQTVRLYDAGDDRAIVDQDLQTLLDLHEEQGLESMMNEAERQAEQRRYLNPQRTNPAMFRKGPEDRFQTVRERETAQIGQPVEAGVADVDLDDTQETTPVNLDDDWFIRLDDPAPLNEPDFDL